MNRFVLAIVFASIATKFGVTGFSACASQAKLTTGFNSHPFSSPLPMSKDNGVVELADDEPIEEVEETPAQEDKVVAPFLSQGEISEEPVDLSDPKQARVMFYIIISLLPVLFLIPLMLGSRDLIPQDILPPVDI